MAAEIARQPRRPGSNAKYSILGPCHRFLTNSFSLSCQTCANIRGSEVFMARLMLGGGRRSSRPGVSVRQSDVETAVGVATNHSVPAGLSLVTALTVLIAYFCILTPAFAQIDVNDVHVTPRQIAKPDAAKPEVAKSDTAANPDISSTSSLTTRVRPLKVDVDMVLVPVTITDPMNRLVTGLERDNFQLFEGNTAQDIKSFSSEDAPVSLGVIFDSSGSMSSKMDRAKDAVMEFFKTANPQDEFFMITFSDEPEEVTDFTSSVDEIQSKLVFAVPRRRTALLDAIYMGVTKMRQAKYPKKALLIISDGGDNHSRYTENEIKSLVKEADVMIYAIGIYDRFFASQEERLGPELLSEITELTGGRAFTIDNPNDLGDVATKIGVELRNQYVLGYKPNKIIRDGKWRKIRVKLLPPKGLPPLRVYARTGYYAPAE
jgi:Ca-activated chloride channel family protein